MAYIIGLADAAFQLYVTCGVVIGITLGVMEIGLSVLNALPVLAKFTHSSGFHVSACSHWR